MSDTSSTHSYSTPKSVLFEIVKHLETCVNIYLAKDDNGMRGVLSPRDVVDVHAKVLEALDDLKEALQTRDLIYSMPSS